MPKARGRHGERRLTKRAIERATPGRHTDGGGLYLVVDRSGAKRWLVRLVIQGKRRDLGLGSTALVDVEEARAKALEYRRKARAGGDPFAEVEKAKLAATPFKMIAQEVHEQVVLNSTRNGKHQDQWINTLKTYAFPTIGDKAMDDITTQDIQNILLPIWLTKSETARRVQQRMGRFSDTPFLTALRQTIQLRGRRKILHQRKNRNRYSISSRLISTAFLRL